jgi:hypothetical protein
MVVEDGLSASEAMVELSGLVRLQEEIIVDEGMHGQTTVPRVQVCGAGAADGYSSGKFFRNAS